MISQRTRLIHRLADVRQSDAPYVGGKSASLGELLANAQTLGINVPGGFVLASDAYRLFTDSARLEPRLRKIFAGLHSRDVRDLQKRARAARELIKKTPLPSEVVEAVVQAYHKLERERGKRVAVAVRSSAVSEDSRGASFAGGYESFLNVVGARSVLSAIRRSFSSLYADRAVSYRNELGFLHTNIGFAIAVQEMVRSDIGSSGVMFTVDPETGFNRVIIINATFGLGEPVVQGRITPDEFVIFQPLLESAAHPIVARSIREKRFKMALVRSGTKIVPVSATERFRPALDDTEALFLARSGVKIAEYFAMPMDIEWAKDGRDGTIFIVQARPETVHAAASVSAYRTYRMQKHGKVIGTGIAVGAAIAAGRVRVLGSPKDLRLFQKGEILVTGTTDPNWVPVMKLSAAIVTDRGGRTSHAAIVSRELGIPALVGVGDATRRVRTGDAVTVDCSTGGTGTLWAGALPFETIVRRTQKTPETRTRIMANIGSPDEAFRLHRLPAKGVGLGRIEFIIASVIGIHPNAMLDFQKIRRGSVRDRALRALALAIDRKTAGYKDKTAFYIEKLSEGIAKIGAVFWPHDAIIRFSDFKTNEYRSLLGGERYEPDEENPMIGWRGASRYTDPRFQEAFGLECRAIRVVREKMGFSNVVPMVPFVRTVEEGKRTIALMKRFGLSRTRDRGLKIYMMCEVPSNVVLADRFLDVFDGMSIGSNDLTQLVLGVDRDSGSLAKKANENDAAVRAMIEDVIAVCKRRNKYVGICGQAPSDFPEFAAFLVRCGIDSISLNPDAVVPTAIRIAREERSVREHGK